MAVYVARDLESEDDGDLTIESGDLVVAGAQQSVRQNLMCWSMTTRGGFSFDPGLGWGAEGFIGRQNTPLVHRLMEEDLGYSYGQADGLALEDLTYSVSHIDRDVAGVTVRFAGLVVEPDGTSPSQAVVLGFSFPFSDGAIQLEVSDE